MSKVKIGFDFDRVFVNYPPFIPSVLIEKLYKAKGNKLTYRYPGKIEQQIRILSHHHLLRPAIPENLTAIPKIFEKLGVETYIISSRFSFLRGRTDEWTKKHKIKTYFKKMFFNFGNEQPHEFKERIIRQEKINKFVDDDLDLLAYLAPRNSKVNFYWISKKRSRKNFPPNIIHIKNLNEFLSNYV